MSTLRNTPPKLLRLSRWPAKKASRESRCGADPAPARPGWNVPRSGGSRDALVGIRRAKKLRTTIASVEGKRTGDLLNRDFAAPAPNRGWATDFTHVRITHVRTWVGFVYVTFVVDLFAQRKDSSQ